MPTIRYIFCPEFVILWFRRLLIFAACCSPAYSASEALPEMATKKVSSNVWYVEGLSALGAPANQNFISNAAFVVTPAGVVVIDALGSPVLAERLLAEIGKVTRQPVTHVIVTHYHADHVYGLQTFKAAGAQILAQRAAKDYITSETAVKRLQDSRQTLAPWINDKTLLVPADQWIDGPITLTVGGVKIEIHAVGPAHTAEDLVVYLPQEKVLFAGDLVFRRRIPFVGQADSGHWIAALDALLGFDAAAVVPGHGPISTNARADIQTTRDYLVHLRSVMGPAARNMEPFEDAYLAADWSRFESLPLFGVANRMNAYNTYLLMEREAK